MSAPSLTVYTDHKNPYAFLAKDRVYTLAAETGATIDWRPYVLDVPQYFGQHDSGCQQCHHTGGSQVAAISRAAEADGVFGVPTFVLDGEMFGGGEHLPDILEMLAVRRV
jgi:2-hydroxychromene-2-carboxylate isomerase